MRVKEGALITCDVPMKEFVRYLNAHEQNSGVIIDQFEEEDVGESEAEYVAAGGTTTVHVSEAPLCQTCQSARARTSDASLNHSNHDKKDYEVDAIYKSCSVCLGRRRHLLVEPSFVAEVKSRVNDFIKRNTFEDEALRTEY